MSSGINDATRILNVVGGIIESKTKSGANIEVTYGQVFGISGATASVYLAGARELAASDGGVPEPSDDFRIPSHLKVAASDYVRVSIDSRGHRWVDEQLTTTTFGKARVDYANGIIEFGDGTTFDASLSRSAAGVLDVTGAALSIGPQDGVNEGGELRLAGAGSNVGWLIDNYSGRVRFHSGGVVFMDLDANRLLLNGGTNTSVINPQLVVGVLSGASAQSVLAFEVGGLRKAYIRGDNGGNIVLGGVGSGATYLSWDNGSGGVIIGDGASSARLRLGTDSTGLITFGSASDTNLYRNAANVLRTDDDLLIAMVTGGGLSIGTATPAPALGIAFGGDVNLYRLSTDNLKTDDMFTAAYVNGLGGVAINGTKVARYVPLATVIQVANGATTTGDTGVVTSAEMTALPSTGVVAVQVTVIGTTTVPIASTRVFAFDFDGDTTSTSVAAYPQGTAGYNNSSTGMVRTGGTNNRQMKYQALENSTGTLTYFVRVWGYWTTE